MVCISPYTCRCEQLEQPRCVTFAVTNCQLQSCFSKQLYFSLRGLGAFYVRRHLTSGNMDIGRVSRSPSATIINTQTTFG
ncbi:uncharacterized protein LOC131674891 isoform X2 [Phymastichus coffea]|uniref:uncharacterized protein LOC131666414 isoform X2 n=1 Tax=Phymastichus coffea TaxID=108790 RepID=UPI00273A78B8|nr:uncharacterized protein LOC131666414 isoform X2 [Phymastichus coffea]XP_058809690.1 uncharacterized protein LOC131674891 isoform X2 [Phymastichus coffea]